MYTCMCVYVYIYIYIYRERERERYSNIDRYMHICELIFEADRGSPACHPRLGPCGQLSRAIYIYICICIHTYTTTSYYTIIIIIIHKICYTIVCHIYIYTHI